MKTKGKKVLLIDNSNTRTKFLISHDGRIDGELAVLPTSDISVESVCNLLSVKDYDAAFVSSVVPASREVLERCFCAPVHFIKHNSSKKLKFDYPGVATLGADRIANVLGAMADGAVPSMVIDAGTAVTFDVLLERDGLPTYVGGAIAPGLSAFTGYLHSKTAQLPSVSLAGEIPAIGKNTVEAIQSGAFFGFCGMVHGIMSKICEELPVKPRIILTGGDAALLHNELNMTTEVDARLMFKGMLAVANEWS